MRRFLALAVLAIAVMPASASAASQKAIWGPVTLPTGASAFPVYDRLGVDVFQIQLQWNWAAPTRPGNPRSPADPAYQWPKALDEAVARGRRHGIKIAVMVKNTPGWANGGRSPAWAPTRVRDFQDFLVAATRRYPSVRHWMIWGETNRAAVFQPLPANRKKGPRRYARLLNASYGTLKRQNRRNKVIGGMTFSFGEVTPRDYVRWMRLPSGRPPRLDFYGHNPFSRRFPNLSKRPYYPGGRDMSDMDTFAREVHRAYRHSYKRFRLQGPKLWLSEFTVSSDRANRAFDFSVSRKQQARWLRAAYRIAHRRREIALLGWFNLHDEPATTPHGLTTGLMTYEGRRKPAFRAYRRAP